jgi:hypothetical protein
LTVTVTPQEIISAGLTLYFAPIGTANPAIDATAAQIIAGGWTLVGTNGQNDYDATGVTVTHNETLATWTSLGSTGASKVWRTDEQLEVAVTLADISPAQYALALNDVAVTTIAATTGVAGEQDVPLLQGISVTCFALLAVGISAVNNLMNAQYAIPAVYQAANPAPVFKKGAPAELALTFATLLDPNGGGFGQLRQQTAAKT